MPFVSLQVIEAELRSTKCWELTTEGEEIAREGSHEARVFRSIPLEGLVQSELMVGPRAGTKGGVGMQVALEYSTCHNPSSPATAQRQGGLQQGHVQQVDPSGQECSRWAPGVPSGESCEEVARQAGGRRASGADSSPHSLVLWQVDSIEDEVQRRLQLVQAGQAEKLAEKERNELRKRKLLTEV